MKVSLSWIADHLEAPLAALDSTHISQLLNKSTAEVEAVRTHTFPVHDCVVVQVANNTAECCTGQIPETGEVIELATHSDAAAGQLYLIRAAKQGYRWATLRDFGLDKDGLMPALHLSAAQAQGAWRDAFAPQTIIEIENKTITHRPDMWCHRGVAREIGALLHVTLRNTNQFLKPVAVDQSAQELKTSQFTLKNEAGLLCKKLTALRCSDIKQQASNPVIAARLLAIGARPINAWVDITNYLMYDWAQPVHAYDLDQLEGKTLIARHAKQGEQITLLGDTTLQLDPADIVIADAKKPVSLGGVKGGFEASLSSNTKNLLLEAAHFDPASVRHSAARHKLRTDAAVRFEKTQDPEQTIQALMRFAHLIASEGLQATVHLEAGAIGVTHQPVSITITHARLEQLLGITITTQRVKAILTALEFGVQETDGTYTVQVPSFRSSKDVTLPEDIAEEIIRFHGYDAITPTLPTFGRSSYALAPILQERSLKTYLANSAQLFEQQNYAFFDDQFLAQMEYQLHSPITLKNVINEHYTRMAGSLVPGLLKNILHNHIQRVQLGFFEIGKTWHGQPEGYQEQTTTAVVVIDKRGTQHFYQGKQLLLELLQTLGIDQTRTTFSQEATALHPWCMPYQTATVSVDGATIGYLARIEPMTLTKLDLGEQTTGFVFEIDSGTVCNLPHKELAYKQLSKFQETYIDLSLLVPRRCAATQVQNILTTISPLVTKVQLIDFFEKESWPEVRSLTMRLTLQSNQRTLVKEEIDGVWQAAVAALEAQNIRIRQE